MEDKIRVLVVDDSLLMRKIISDGINSDPALEVIDKARNGKEALEKIFSLKPDVVTLDINLPIIDGISVLEEVMKKQPTRVLILSAYTREGTSATMRALELGAIDFITKPSGEISLDIYKLKDTIASKIKLAAKVDLDKFLPVGAVSSSLEKPASIRKLVVIGASTGGPKAVLNIMQNIPEGLPAAFLIVQHMPKGFTTSFAERISWQGKIKTKEAQDLDIVLADKGFVAPAGYHMLLEKSPHAVRIKLNQGPLVNFVRPSIDVTMASAAEAFGKNVIGVILSGMGKDGLEGCQKIKKRGGTIIVQDEETSVVWGMPRAVYEADLADKILPVAKIAESIAGAIAQ
ncbi:chemotaxis response regulator protein-glutamate methylesterase [bacterium]|nr:MAG: chemotaxis response regulator protein-glutamate methylesterase [bacterium]